MPLKANTDSVSTAPASSAPVCRPMVVDTGSIALRSTCRRVIRPGARPLALRGADVVLVQHLEHRGPGHPDDDRQRDGAEREGRQDQVQRPHPRRRPTPG